MVRLFDHFDLDSWRLDPPALPGGLYGLFRQVAARYASRRALETVDGQSWTYAGLESCRWNSVGKAWGPMG